MAKNINMTEAIDSFVDRLLLEKKFEVTDPEVLEKIREDLAERAEDRVNMAVLANMPEEKLAEFNRLLDTATLPEIQEYCQENIPDLDEVIAKELVNFRNIYLNS